MYFANTEFSISRIFPPKVQEFLFKIRTSRGGNSYEHITDSLTISNWLMYMQLLLQDAENWKNFLKIPLFLRLNIIMEYKIE